MLHTHSCFTYNFATIKSEEQENIKAVARMYTFPSQSYYIPCNPTNVPDKEPSLQPLEVSPMSPLLLWVETPLLSSLVT